MENERKYGLHVANKLTGVRHYQVQNVCEDDGTICQLFLG